MPLADRLGVEAEQVDRVDLLVAPRLADPETLLQAAFDRGPTDSDAAGLLLAAALLSQAQRITEGRHAAALALLARLVARADPRKTLGPDGMARRAELMPNGWKYTIGSWPRLRYAWREGLRDLLEVRQEDDATADALDEVTRLTAAEPEPVSVAIQESWPQPRVAFAVTFVGVTVAGWALWRELSYERRARGERRARRR